MDGGSAAAGLWELLLWQQDGDEHRWLDTGERPAGGNDDGELSRCVVRGTGLGFGARDAECVSAGSRGFGRAYGGERYADKYDEWMERDEWAAAGLA